MAHLTHFLGSILVMLWFVVTFMGESIHKIIPAPYSDDLVRYKWLILGLGIFLAVSGFFSNLKKRKADKRWEKKTTESSRIQRGSFETQQLKQSALDIIDPGNETLKALAQKVSWSPLAGGGANFKTSYLATINSSRLEVVKSKGAWLFGGTFAVMGLIIPGVIASGLIAKEGFGWSTLFLALFSLVFVGAGVAMLYYPRPRIFDKNHGWFWLGNKQLNREQDFIQLKQSARLSEIAAIQIVSERMSGKNSSYTSWEINLISEDAQRLNVMDHGKKQSILEDAQKLGEFLDVPVWENV